MMWPERGSGFQASPLSPAGVAEGRWRAVLARRRPTERERMQATVAGAVVAGAVLVIAVVGLAIHLLS